MASEANRIADRLSPHTLMLLGEAASKCDHIARIPFPFFGDAVDARALALCAAANTTLAGYRLSRALTAELARECRPDADRATASEGDRVFTNLVGVLAEGPRLDEPAVEAATLLNERILAGVAGGTGVTGNASSWAQQLADNYTDPEGADEDSTVRMRSAFVRATLVHLATLQHRPFASGNGRTARVLEAAVLSGAGLPLRVSGMLACHYAEDTRRYRTIVKRVAAGGAVDEFVEYSLAGFVTILRDELEYVMQPMWMRQQVQLIWGEFVASQFARLDAGPATTRRCRLACDLPQNGVPRERATSVSAEVHDLYRHVAAADLDEDLIALQQMELVTLDGALAIPRLDKVPLWLAPF